MTFSHLPQIIDEKLIILYFVSSKLFSDWKSVKISLTAPRYSKILLHWIIFFKKFQNYRRELANSSFAWQFYTEKIYNGPFFDKVNIWEDITSFVILSIYDVTESRSVLLVFPISNSQPFLNSVGVYLNGVYH